jgi:hypothetical protein
MFARGVAASEVVITDAISGLVELANHRGQPPSLTPRERDVLRARVRRLPAIAFASSP